MPRLSRSRSLAKSSRDQTPSSPSGQTPSGQTHMPPAEHPLIQKLRAALNSPIERRRLLQQPTVIQTIFKNISARQWLIEQWHMKTGARSDSSQTPATDPVLSLIVDMMKCSRSIWRGGAIAPEIYEEAHAKTWAWFMTNLARYQPEKASFTTWFNNKLKWMIVDESRRLSEKPVTLDDRWIEPPAQDPDRWHDTVDEWLRLVRANGQLLTCRLRESPQVNCQKLLLEILLTMREMRELEEVEWAAIAQRHSVPPAALQRFCKRRCFAHFKAFMSD